MRQQNEHFLKTLIWIESILGVFCSLFFAFLVLYTDTFKGVLKGEMLEGLIRFYVALSLIFFIAVVPIGIFGAIRLHRTNRIVRAFWYAILYWLFSSIVFGLLSIFFSDFLIIIIFIPLAAIIYGFNRGLNMKAETSPYFR